MWPPRRRERGVSGTRILNSVAVSWRPWQQERVNVVVICNPASRIILIYAGACVEVDYLFWFHQCWRVDSVGAGVKGGLHAVIGLVSAHWQRYFDFDNETWTSLYTVSTLSTPISPFLVRRIWHTVCALENGQACPHTPPLQSHYRDSK